ncbi:MAG: hypothetical protein ACLS8T_33090 [Anaerobutyricum sp.]
MMRMVCLSSIWILAPLIDLSINEGIDEIVEQNEYVIHLQIL